MVETLVLSPNASDNIGKYVISELEDERMGQDLELLAASAMARVAIL